MTHYCNGKKKKNITVSIYKFRLITVMGKKKKAGLITVMQKVNLTHYHNAK